MDKKATTIRMDRLGLFDCPHCTCSIDISEVAPFSTIVCPSCDSEVVVPAKMDHFFVFRKLGGGGMGLVYLARDEQLNREVAVKVLRPRALEKPDALEQFKREAVALAALHHPHIASVFSYNAEGNQAYIVMEYVRGRSLDLVVESGKRLDQATACRVAIDMVSALEEADKAGIIHADIKPANIITRETGESVLVDFGLAHFGRDALSDSSSIWGTPFYVPPERLQKKPDNALADQYRLGATLFHLVVGKAPFDGDDAREVVRAIRNNPIPRASEQDTEIMPLFSDVIQRMMDKNPSRRYPTYTSLLADLKQVQTKLKTWDPDAARAAADAERRHGGGLKWIILGSCLLLGLGLLLVLQAMKGPVAPDDPGPTAPPNPPEEQVKQLEPIDWSRNLLRNADFFVADTNQVDRWQFDGPNKASVEVRRSDHGKVLVFKPAGATMSQVSFSQRVRGMEENSRYLIGLDVRAEGEAEAIEAFLEVALLDRSTVLESATVEELDEHWRRVEFSVLTSSKTDLTFRITIGHEGEISRKIFVRWPNVMLVR